MLVLTLKPNEKVVIGADIVVSVTSIKAGKVRIAFDAPKTTPILREKTLRDLGATIKPPQE